MLHIIVRLDEIVEGRKDVIPPSEFLQLAVLKMSKGKTFKPHKHILKDPHPHNTIAQESWVVLTGKVKAILYDIDDTIIAQPVLTPGDCSITLLGGHNYEILDEGTTVFEYKTGPYSGQQMDKVFI